MSEKRVAVCTRMRVCVCMCVCVCVVRRVCIWRGIMFTPEFGGFASFQAVALLILDGLAFTEDFVNPTAGSHCKHMSRCRSSAGQEIHGGNSKRFLVQQ